MEKKTNKKLIVSIILTSIAFLGFIALMVLVLCDYSFKIDEFNVYIANSRTNFLNAFFKIFTYLGSFYVLATLALVGVLLIAFKLKNKGLAWFYTFTFAIVCVLNYLIKICVRRARPEHFMIIQEMGFSFPSGHAMMSFGFFALVIHFVVTYLNNKPLKCFLILVFSILTLLIGFSRIYLGVHFLTDIIAGFLISYVIVTICFLVYRTKRIKFLRNKGDNNEE